MTTENARRIIAPILKLTYGEGAMVDTLATDLADHLAKGEFDDRGRQHEVMLRCWDWFPGGDTAEAVAAKVEEALRAVEVSA